jgi:hypothetical protein
MRYNFINKYDQNLVTNYMWYAICKNQNRAMIFLMSFHRSKKNYPFFLRITLYEPRGTHAPS